MIGGQRYEFGVSGLLYKRNLLFYDRQTDSLWSQLLSEAVTGPLAGTHLALLPGENTTWGMWKKEHPATQVLSFVTGYSRNYNEDPYGSSLFRRDPALWVCAGGVSKIYPFSKLKKTRSPVVDQLGGRAVTIVFDGQSNTARLENGDSAITSFIAFLDDLKAFYPEAEIYRSSRR